jgi:hypothetical protein
MQVAAGTKRKILSMLVGGGCPLAGRKSWQPDLSTEKRALRAGTESWDAKLLVRFGVSTRGDAHGDSGPRCKV